MDLAVIAAAGILRFHTALILADGCDLEVMGCQLTGHLLQHQRGLLRRAGHQLHIELGGLEQSALADYTAIAFEYFMDKR
ncbi:hypothetical protein D3C73_1227380 [compost metagenome]